MNLLKVLLTEPSAMIRQRICFILSELANVKVVGQAETFDNLLPLVQKLQPDVIIMDMWLLQKESMRSIERIKLLPNAPIIIDFTAHTAAPYRHKSYTAGVDYFFDKSTELDNVLKTLCLLRDLKLSKNDKEPNK